MLLACVGAHAEAQVFRCADAAGTVTYQQRPCEGKGSAVDVRPANAQERAPIQQIPPVPAEASVAATARAGATAEERTPAQDYQKPGLRLRVGMSERQVIESWGLPTDLHDYGGGWYFLWWCDMRMALMVDGRLRSWDAPFEDSVRGANLFSYGEPWIRASQRWGYERKVEAYSGPRLGRGEVQKWTPLRWVVTDSHGRLVSWCDAAEHRSPEPPPAFNPPWDNALKR